MISPTKRYFTFYDDLADAAAKAAADKAAADKAAADKAAADKAAAETKTYSEDEYKQAIENERKREADKARVLSQQLEDLKKVAGKSELLEKQIKELQESLLTKEQLAQKKLEEKELAAKSQVETLTKERDTWQNRFQNTLIQREILDAASKEGAYDPGIFINLLKERVSTAEVLDEEGKPSGFYKVVVRLDSTDKAGKVVPLSLNPEEAVKHLKSQPEKYGYLFKGIGVPGSGSNSEKTKFEKMDLESMDLETYKKFRDKIKS